MPVPFISADFLFPLIYFSSGVKLVSQASRRTPTTSGTCKVNLRPADDSLSRLNPEPEQRRKMLTELRTSFQLILQIAAINH